MSLQFAPAKRSEAKARVALIGPTGAGKTHIVPGVSATVKAPDHRIVTDVEPF